MASLLRTRVLSLRPASMAVSVVVRPLSTTGVRRHGESQSSQFRFRLPSSSIRSHYLQTPADPEFEVDKLKQESLQRQKKGEGEWMPNLASDSEEAVKADKSGFNAKDAVAQAKRARDAKTSGNKNKA